MYCICTFRNSFKQFTEDCILFLFTLCTPSQFLLEVSLFFFNLTNGFTSRITFHTDFRWPLLATGKFFSFLWLFHPIPSSLSSPLSPTFSYLSLTCHNSITRLVGTRGWTPVSISNSFLVLLCYCFCRVYLALSLEAFGFKYSASARPFDTLLDDSCSIIKSDLTHH